MERHQAEVIVQGLLDGHNLADLFPPVGSPAYVRRLRDQAALRLWVRDTSVSSAGAADAANSLVIALGYQPPGEPGKGG